MALSLPMDNVEVKVLRVFIDFVHFCHDNRFAKLRYVKLFTEKHDCNTRTPGKIQVLLNTRRVSSIKQQREFRSSSD